MTQLWKTILEVTRWAPSPHNVQPWKLWVESDESAWLYLDSLRTLPDEDETGHFLAATMGIFEEITHHVAQNSNYLLTVNRVPFHTLKEGRYIPYGKLSLTQDTALAPSRYSNSLIHSRLTSRLGYSSKAITTETLTALQSLFSETPYRISIQTEPATIEAVINCNIEAVLKDMNTPKYHHEILRWFRYTETQSLETQDGLDARCMNIPGWLFWLSAHTPFLARLPLASSLMKTWYRRKLMPTSALGFLQGPFFESQEEAIQAGKYLARFWLEMAYHGLYLHPFGNLVTNAKAHQWLTKSTNLQDIWLVFRMGYSETPPASKRLPLTEILLQENPI